MRSLKAITAGLLLMSGVAHADLSATVTAVNDYDFRGVSLSATDPAVQASIDWAAGNGFYVGAWGSNVDFGPGTEADYEVDVYAGFSGGAENGFGYSAGIVYYSYWPEEDPNDINYPEIFVGGSYGIFNAKFWYTNDYGNLDEDAYYLEGNLNFELPASFSLIAHAGYNFGDYWSDVNGDETIDYSLGVGYSLGNFDMMLKYVDTETDVKITGDPFNNEDRLIFSVVTTFPWSGE